MSDLIRPTRSWNLMMPSAIDPGVRYAVPLHLDSETLAGIGQVGHLRPGNHADLDVMLTPKFFGSPSGFVLPNLVCALRRVSPALFM